MEKPQEVRVANTFLKQLKGFMFEDKPEKPTCIIYPEKKLAQWRIHMAFVKFPIILTFVDDDYIVREVWQLQPGDLIESHGKYRIAIEFVNVKEPKIGEKLSWLEEVRLWD